MDKEQEPEGRDKMVELLKGAEIVSHTYVADDGYLSTVIHSDEEAAQRAADVLWDAGYRKVNLNE